MSWTNRSRPFFLYVLLVFIALVPFVLGTIASFEHIIQAQPRESTGIYYFLLVLLLFMSGTIAYFASQFFIREIPNWDQEWKYIVGKDLLTREQISILEKYQPYYQNLTFQHKKEFEKRVAVFCSRKEFRAKGDIKQISDLHRILIGSCAAQLTFGLPELSFRRLRRIFLYQSEFLNPFTKAKRKGETSTKGHIVFSWKHFLEGFAYPNDAINLGLHEMAHALRIENRINQEDDQLFIPMRLWKEWDQYAIPIFDAINNGKHTFLRKYAGANEEEFFAVCVEHFFEKPVEFQKELPKLYIALCKILNQNPVKNLARGY